MHRWATRFGTIWLSLLIPSLVGWGFVVRWNPSGADRFERTWTWLANLLAFPLVVHALTDRSWLWLKGDSAPLATSGFAILLVAWCLMIALPTSILLSWADWLGNRISPSTHLASATSYGTHSSTMSSSSAINVLYLITVPAALIWHTLRWLLRTLLPFIFTFLLVWICIFSFYIITLHTSSPYEWIQHLVRMNDAWNGYLSTFGYNHLYINAWDRHYTPSIQLAVNSRSNSFLWSSVVDDTTEYPHLLKLLTIFATMHALIVAFIVGLITGLTRTGQKA